MSECNHNCESCSQKDCDSRSFIVSAHKNSHIKKIIGVISGKGGVGKSFVTSLLAVKKANEGNKVAILDADITGPSIPKMFGTVGYLTGDEQGIFPVESKKGIKIASSTFCLDDPSDPIIYRGPLIGGMVKQFYTDVVYGDVDYMFIDMPPGTGDVALTVFQSIKLDGIVIVTTPQDLVSLIVKKAVKMANKMNIKILGIIENMSYFECPDCHKKIEVFGKSHVDEVADEYGLNILGKLPINPNVAALADLGKIEDIDTSQYKIDL